MKRAAAALTALALTFGSALRLAAENPHPDAQWFPEAGFGLFIHWGIASVNGINISWSMRPGSVLSRTRVTSATERARIVAEKDYNLNGRVPLSPNQYWAQAASFNPQSYDPDRWLAAARDAGFTYAVLTTRHHEGFAMWPSAYGSFNTRNFMNGRDLVRPFVEACRRQGLKVGLYYSPPDWRYDRRYLDFFWPGVRTLNPEFKPLDPDLEPVTLPARDAAHQQAYAAMVRGQVEELLTSYGTIDLFWFDGKPGGLSGDQCITQARMRELQPGIVINPRLHGTGDFVTYERTFPTSRPTGWAEFCDAWTGTWSYTPGGTFHATGHELGVLARAKAWRMSYLLSNGPSSTGELPAMAYTKMAEMRGWMQANAESVNGVAPLPAGETASVPATARGTLRYLFGIPRFNGSPVPANQLAPVTETLTLSGVVRPSRVTLLGSGASLAFTHANGTATITLPASVRTNLVDVARVDLATAPTPTPSPTAPPNPRATPTPTPTPCASCGFSGYYRIVARHSGKAMVVQGASTANGANVFQWAYGGSNTNDEWEIRSIGGGYYRFINRHSGKDLNVAGASTANSADIVQYAYGGATTNDEWQPVDLGNGYYRIVARHSGKVVNVAGASTADGADINQYAWANVNQQHFQIVNVP